jgi:DNA-binding NarL/FixJ family response regulator
VKRRLVIADAQTIVREALHALLAAVPGLEVVGTAESSAEAVRLAEVLQPDAVLLDISMDAGNLVAMHDLRRAAPRSRLLVLTAQEGEDEVWAALQAGADGYVLKESSRDELLTAIDTVLRGQRFITPAVSAQIVGRYLQRRSALPPA